MVDSSQYTFAVRGAIQLNEDSISAMDSAVSRLVVDLLKLNNIEEPQIVSILFSQSSDLIAANPAYSLRKQGFRHTALFCTQEPVYVGALPRIVRVIVHYRAAHTHRPQPLYLDGATQLRNDITATNVTL